MAADDTGKRTVSGPAAQCSDSVPEETSLWCPGPNCNTSVNADGLKNTLKKWGFTCIPVKHIHEIGDTVRE